MLQNLGDVLKAQRWLAYLVLGALALVFAAWGAYGIVDVGFGGGTYAAKVNGEKISLNEANELWQRQQAQLAQLAGGQLTPEQRTQFQQRLLDGQILNLASTQQARQLGFRVSDAQLLRAIQTEQAFQIDGAFNAQAYRSRLASAGITEAAFEADLQKSLLSEQLAAAIGGTEFLTPAEAGRLLALQDEQREVRYLLLQPEAYEPGPAIADSDIEAYYNAHAAEFTPPEAVKLAYAELTLADAAKGVVVSEEALRERYEKAKDSYMEPERRRARHILIAVDAATDDAKAKTEADALYQRLQKGEDFAALARSSSKDSASAAEGGDLGWASRDAYVPAFADALFALKEGETSAPVKTQFGYHIIRLEGIRPGNVRTFEDVRAELAAQLRNDLAAEAFGNRQEELQARIERGGSTLAQLAQEFGLHTGEIERFERGTGGLPLGSDAELNREVFSDRVLNQRQVGGPIPLGEDRLTVVQVVDHFAPQVQPLAEVRASIVATLTRQRGSEEAAKAAQAALAKLQAGTSYAQVAKDLKLKPEAPRFVGRDDPELPVELRTAVFLTPKPGAVQRGTATLEGGVTALFEVTAVRNQPASDNPQVIALRGQRELQRYALREVDAYFTEVIKAARVTKNPQAFAQ
ncbi:MAG: SurA N-terminal domain-containing protein [Steroidobacteraceae bacterium]